MTDAQQRVAAKKFAEDWKDKGYEKRYESAFLAQFIKGCLWG